MLGCVTSVDRVCSLGVFRYLPCWSARLCISM